MIPKTIFTIWLGGTVPEYLQKSVDSHMHIDGYEHRMISDANYYRGSDYVNDCIEAGQYAKAADYLRVYYLYTEGGIYLDADVEVLLNKSFDAFLEHEVFCGREKNGFVSNAIIGAEKGSPLLGDYLVTVDSNFKGSGSLIYQPGMYLWTEKTTYNPLSPVVIYDPEYFLPFNWQDGTMQMTEHTVCIHHFNRSWVKAYPTVSIIIPTLGRPEGLQRCLNSIQALNYPQGLIDVCIVEGEEQTVPEKVKEGVGRTKGEYIVYAANDVEFDPESIATAVRESLTLGKALVSFHSGSLLPDAGNACEHFMIRRDFIPWLKNAEIFDCRYYHVGVDNFLMAQAKKRDQFYHSNEATVTHHHFTKGAEFDHVYAKGWDEARVAYDRSLLAQDLEALNSAP